MTVGRRYIGDIDVQSARMMYASAIAIFFISHLFMLFKIGKEKNEEKVCVIYFSSQSSSPFPCTRFVGPHDQLASLRHDINRSFSVQVKSKNPQTGQMESLTVEAYDRREVINGLRGQLIGSLFVGFLHYKKGLLPPLLFQSIMMPFNLVDNKMFRIHVLGESDDDLKRPFKATGFLANLMEGMNPDNNQVATKGRKKDKEEKEKKEGKGPDEGVKDTKTAAKKKAASKGDSESSGGDDDDDDEEDDDVAKKDD